jgi:hypothetical protein
MNTDMTGGAILISGVGKIVSRSHRKDPVSLAAELVGSVMAFQAQGENDRTAEKARVH